MTPLTDLIRSFMEGYNALKPEEKNFFMQHFLDEVKKSKGGEENFIDAFLSEIKKTASPKNEEDHNFIERFIEEVQNHIPLDLSNAKQELQKGKAMFVLPIGYNYFNQVLNQKIDLLFDKHHKELTELGYISKEKLGENEICVFDRDKLFSEEQIQGFKKEYAKSYFDALAKKYPEKLNFVDLNQEGGLIIECPENKQGFSQEAFLDFMRNHPIGMNELNPQWTKEISIKNIKSLKSEFLKQDFIESLEKEYESIKAPKQEQKQEQEPQNKSETKDNKLEEPQYASLSDWFEKIKIEHKNFKISKEDFKKRFIQYCQNNMNESEMKILLVMANKSPSILTPEHKQLIHNGLEASNTNAKLADRGLQCCIKAQIGESLNQEDRALMKQFLESKRGSSDPIDQKLYESFAFSKNQNILSNLGIQNKTEEQTKTQRVKR